MSKPYTVQNLSDLLDGDLIWRRKELSDIKTAIRAADQYARTPLLRALVAMAYAHWEGYARFCAERYFEHITLRRLSYDKLERQIYVNSHLAKLDGLRHSRANVADRSKIISEIMDETSKRFAYVNPTLIDTKSNLNTDVIKELCLICGVSGEHFEGQRTFIDVIILKRRNAIAHGQLEFVAEEEVDGLVSDTLALMNHFRTVLENKAYTKGYMAPIEAAPAHA